MRQVYRIDEEGFLVEPILLQDTKELPTDCVDRFPANGLYKARFIDGEWIEGLTQEEIEELQNVPQEPSELDKLKKQQADLVFELLMKGVI